MVSATGTYTCSAPLAVAILPQQATQKLAIVIVQPQNGGTARATDTLYFGNQPDSAGRTIVCDNTEHRFVVDGQASSATFTSGTASVFMNMTVCDLVGCINATSAFQTSISVVDTSAFYTVTNKGNGLCVDVQMSGTADGTPIQQYTCNGTLAQKFQFQPASDGYYNVANLNDTTKVWDVTGGSTASGTPIILFGSNGLQHQQWLPVSEGNGNYHFVVRSSGKCLDVPQQSTAISLQLQQYTCNGTVAQSFSLST